MNVAFRVDASATLGIGHVMRCLRLADALAETGAHVRFVSKELTAGMERLLGERGHECVRLPGTDDAAETSQALRDRAWDWIAVDHYGLDARWEGALRRHAGRILAIDDLADRPHDCDLLVDQNLYLDGATRYAGRLPERCVALLGPRYALLDRSFAAARFRARVRTGPVSRVLVCFGGADPGNHTGAAVEALRRTLDPAVRVDVVIGAAHPYMADVTQACTAAGYTLHVQSMQLAALMADADLGIGAGGSMTWERCSVGLPTLVLTLAENQRQVVRDGAAAGILYAPDDRRADTPDALAVHLRALIENAGLRALISRTGMEQVDGEGLARVTREMGALRVTVREARIEDAAATLGWRNRPDVRAVSHDQREIDAASHHRWFASVIADPNRLLLIGARDGLDIGVVRFDVDGDGAEVSIYLSPGPHPKGTGGQLLAAGEHWLIDTRADVARSIARVRAGNEPSHRMFTAAGYLPDSTTYCKVLARRN